MKKEDVAYCRLKGKQIIELHCILHGAPYKTYLWRFSQISPKSGTLWKGRTIVRFNATAATDTPSQPSAPIEKNAT
jgi:hypothetical protein